jgi:uncharacterized coiled-coil protein SlyX
MGIADEIRKELDTIAEQSAETLRVTVTGQTPTLEETVDTLVDQIAALSDCLVKVAAVTDRLWEVNRKLLARLNGHPE